MAEGKKSFVAYSDWKNIFDELPNEEAGMLIKHIFAYVNDEDPISDSILIRAVFANIKSTLKRDLSKWDNQLIQRSEAGKRSAEKRAAAKSNESSTVVEIRERNPTVSVNDSVSDSVILLEKETKELSGKKPDVKIDFEKLVNFINTVTGRNFQTPNKTIQAKYNARIKEGFTKDRILKAIHNASKDQFHKDNGFKYLTPEYFSRAVSIEKHESEQINKPIEFKTT